MERAIEIRNDDLIDLGTAAGETKGGPGPVKDEQGGILFTGPADD